MRSGLYDDHVELEASSINDNINVESKAFDGAPAAGQVPKHSVSDEGEASLTDNDRVDMERMGKKQVLRVSNCALFVPCQTKPWVGLGSVD